MNETAKTAETIAPPRRRMLLATDLSARCDRALDRAAQLAQEWQSELIALNVFDLSSLPDQSLAWLGGASDAQLLQVAREELARDLAIAGIQTTPRVVRGTDAAAEIRNMAATMQAELVITGVSANETLGRFLLGSTVEALARSLPLPLLVVRNRPRGPYRRIVVASDFSELSRHALMATAERFPGRELVLYHVHASPMAGLVDTLPPSEDGFAVQRAECDAFLAATPLPQGTSVRQKIERGAVEAALARYVRRHDVELVVVGSRSSSGINSLLLGSTAARLLDWLPCDTLLVPHP
ncbi:Universal stress protein [Cupriavidus oxalaticus]|uniref:universal stress protein n=1 Tax=Cupriavidus oxalaticus TaxID=96344 RepID=UPI003F73BA70